MKQTTLSALALALVLATWPQAPMAAGPRCYPVGRFISAAGGVRDSLTRLVWQGQASSASMKWSAAQAYCSSAGYRLPTIKELASIVDPTVDSGARVYRDGFPDMPPDLFWTSSPYAGSSRSAWYVDFSIGLLSNIDVGTELRALCVR